MKKCIIFNCDKKHKNMCCYFCELKRECKNHCLNTPLKCGQIKNERTEKN